MRTLDPTRSALVLVDYQSRLMPAIAGGPQALAQAVLLADVARLLGVPVVGTEQNPRGLGPNDEAVRTRCEATLAKLHFDACADGLGDWLRRRGHPPPTDLVVAGCEAHVCLLQTALGLLREGFVVWVVAAACGSRRASDHELAMQRLRQAGAWIVSTEMVAFEWLGGCTHERFRPVLECIKRMPA